MMLKQINSKRGNTGRDRDAAIMDCVLIEIWKKNSGRSIETGINTPRLKSLFFIGASEKTKQNKKHFNCDKAHSLHNNSSCWLSL